jgi:hypothetical protein
VCLHRVLRAVLVLLLEALVVLGLVTGVTTALVVLGLMARRCAVVVVLGTLGTTVALVNVDVAMLFEVGWRLAIAVDPDIAVFFKMLGGSTIALDPDLPVDVRGVAGLRRRRLLVDIDVDVRLLLGGVLGLGLVRLLDGLQSSQVAERFAQTGMRDVELLLPVLQLLLLAQEPVDAVPHADTTPILDIASDAFGVRRDVLEGTAHVAHAPVDPFGLFRVGFEDVVDLADRQQASHFVKVGSNAANDAHVDGIGGTDVAHTFGFGQEFGELVGSSKSASSGTQGQDLSFNHDGR